MRNTFLSLCCILALSATAQTWPASTLTTRAGSRWWWLGSAVEKQELSRNMRDYAAHGIRTLEITPIYGGKGNDANNIDFLSPQWMEMLRFVEQEGLRDSIQIDMNCGTGWPFGGPTVSVDEATCRVAVRVDTIVVDKKGDVCHPIRLTESTMRLMSTTEDDGPGTMQTARLERVMAYPLSGKGTVTDLTAGVRGDNVFGKLPEGKWQILALYHMRTMQQVNRAAPGGEGNVIDHFDARAVANYLQRFEEAFTKSGVPYPTTFFNDSYEVYGADWTPHLLDEFCQRRGYPLEQHLPILFFGTGPEAERVLIDYRETLSELLLENFTEQWTDWAHRHGVLTRNQAHGSPANLIDHYATVDIPEVEGFGLTDFGIKGLRKDEGKTRKNYSDLSMLKYASSAAHITGKPLTSCETFTWLTEHFRTSLSQLKPDLDLVFCAGVNRMLYHGTCYSPANYPWPGWRFYASIDMSPTNTLWRDAPFFNQYIDRCQRFLQMGQPDNDFLVYLPVRDMWAQRKGDLLMMFEISNMDKNAPEFIQAVLTIDSLGYDCDYISDRYLLTTTWHDGQLQTAAGTRYDALIVPECRYMPEAVQQHIAQLRRQGATIIDGIDAAAMQACKKPETMKSRHSLNLIRRKNDTGYHYFIANLTPHDVDQWITPAVDFADAYFFHPLTGNITRAECDDASLHLMLRSGESVILQTYDQPLDIALAATESNKESTTIDITHQPWTLSFVESAPRVERTFTLPQLQTWETLDDDSAKVTMGTGAYTTHVRMSKRQARQQWTIDLGDVRESARVYINGVFVGCAWSVPFVLDCGKAFRKGDNTITIEVTNLPANRIADMDRRKVPWRKFNNINVVDIHYKHTTYEAWNPVPSGLNASVVLHSR